MTAFIKTLNAWNTPDFNNTLLSEIKAIDAELLPLQKALSQSSYVSNSDFNVVVLNTSDDESNIVVKTGVFFTGVIAGSCCSDDPTPIDEIQEYCELQFLIDKETADWSVALISN